MNNESKSTNVVPITGAGSHRASVSLARLPAPIHRAREKASQLLQQMLKSLFDGADDALFDLADNANSNQEQNIYFEAMREVRLKRHDIEKGYFLELDQAYAALLRSAVADTEGFGSDFSLEDLTLVGNDQLEFQVAVESMISKALEQAAEPAQHIALRFDSLLPVKVYQQNNPLGPEVVCRSFWRVIEPLEVDIKAKLILLKLFDKAVMSQLLKVYTVINNVLIQQNILPSLSVKPRTGPVRTLVSGTKHVPVGIDDVKAAVGVHSRRDSELLTQLRQLLNPGSVVSASLQGEQLNTDGLVSVGVELNSGELAQALNALQRDIPTRSDSELALLDSAQILKLIQRQGQNQARLSSVDKDVIHLINMLFEFILDDRNLAPTMKAVLSRLQIPMLKIAVDDKGFFNVSGHPARRLLNELATAALGWQEPEELPPTDLLFKKICAVVESVLKGFEDDITVFEGLLTDFIAFMEKEQRRAVILERRTLDAEDGRAKSEQARRRVAQQLQNITSGQPVPECVQAILNGPWHNVLFLQLLKHGEESDEWIGASETVNDLIWSVTANMDREARSRLMSLLPDLLMRLKAGFETIAFNPFEANQLLQQLEQEHLSRLRQPDTPVDAHVPQSGTEELLPAQKSVGAESAGAEPDSLTPVVNPETESAVSPVWLEQVNRFSQGAWFEVADEGKPVYRCRLAAIIPGVDKFIFVNRNGMKVAEKSRLELAQALERGLFQLLDDSMLFDRALESVIGNLRAARARRD